MFLCIHILVLHTPISSKKGNRKIRVSVGVRSGQAEVKKQEQEHYEKVKPETSPSVDLHPADTRSPDTLGPCEINSRTPNILYVLNITPSGSLLLLTN